MKTCLRICGLIVIAGFAVQALPASPQEEAKRIYERVAGVPPTASQLEGVMAYYQSGRIDLVVMAATTNTRFYSGTLVDMFSKYSNIDGIKNTPLNDMTTSIAGLVANNERFDQVLYGDFIYLATDDLSTYSVTIDTVNQPVGPLNRTGAQSNSNPPAGKIRPLLIDSRFRDNRHYEDLQRVYYRDWPSRLQKKTLSSVAASSATDQRIVAEDIAGLLTGRAMGLTNFAAGTNRRAVKNAFETFLCKDLNQLHDKTAPESKIRQDVDRSPSGDSRAFENQCRGCHAGMDALAGAFSYFNPNMGVTDRLEYNRTINTTQNKMFRQRNVFPAGHIPLDNSWINYWWEGPNAALGWRDSETDGSFKAGFGARSMGAALAATEAFSDCMSTRAFQRICMREPTSKERDSLKPIARQFEHGFRDYESFQADGPYNMRALTAQVANLCLAP